MASSSAFFKKGILVIWALLLGGHAQIYNFEDQHIQTGFQPIWYPPHEVSLTSKAQIYLQYANINIASVSNHVSDYLSICSFE